MVNRVNSSFDIAFLYTHPVLLLTGLTVQFDPVIYRVTEGEGAELRLVLSEASTSDVTVVLNSADVSTSGVLLVRVDHKHVQTK